MKTNLKSAKRVRKSLLELKLLVPSRSRSRFSSICFKGPVWIGLSSHNLRGSSANLPP